MENRCFMVTSWVDREGGIRREQETANRGPGRNVSLDRFTFCLAIQVAHGVSRGEVAEGLPRGPGMIETIRPEADQEGQPPKRGPYRLAGDGGFGCADGGRHDVTNRLFRCCQ